MPVMFEVKRDLDYTHYEKLIRAWNEWGIPRHQQIGWLTALGFLEPHDRLRWKKRDRVYTRLLNDLVEKGGL